MTLPWRYDSPARSVVGQAAGIGMATGGIIGALVGLIVGLSANAPTAPFAMVEASIPGAILGASVGLLVGLTIKTVRAIASHRAR